MPEIRSQSALTSARDGVHHPDDAAPEIAPRHTAPLAHGKNAGTQLWELPSGRKREPGRPPGRDFGDGLAQRAKSRCAPKSARFVI
jgi:hypothetical protein